MFNNTAVAQGVNPPTYLNDDENGVGNGFFIKGAHSSISQGVVTDPAGRVWTSSNALGFYVANPDGTEYRLTSPDLTYAAAPGAGLTQAHVSAIFTTAANTNETVTGGRGLALAHDGHILIAAGNTLWKLNHITGAPIARWVSPAANIAAPSSDANGNIFISSVTQNKQYIIRQSTTNPATFETVMAETAFTPRNRVAGAVVRSTAISRDGKTLYIPYADPITYIEKYTSTDMVNWTHVGDIENGAASNAIWAGRFGKLYYVTFGTASSRPKLHFRDETNLARNWSQELTEIGANDIRGLSLTEGYDTAYIASGDTNGNVYRYITMDDVITGIRNDAEAQAVVAYPVPTSGVVTLELPESLRRNTKIQVTDLAGKSVLFRQSAVSNGSSLDFTGLAAGTYLVMINTPEGKIVRRVVKQ